MNTTTKFKSLIILICFFACSFNTIANDTLTFIWQGGVNKTFYLKVTSFKRFIVNWGDGTINSYDSFNHVSHTYANTDNYTVTVRGATTDCLFEYFYCYNSQISDLDVSKALSLTRLECQGNQLSSLDVSNNTALRELVCSNNQLSNLDVSKNTDLIRLNCSYNQLNSLNINNIASLQYLDCRNNQLSNLDVSSNTALTYLECSYNRLSTLDVNNNAALIELYCRCNQLSDLNVKNNTDLKELYCDNNQLNNIDVSNNTALIRLSCDYNQLSILDVYNNTALTHLYCYSNRLNNLNVSNNITLRVLDCSDNQLDNLDVSNNQYLTLLSCDYNQLSTLDLSNHLFLKYLYCSSNQLNSLDIGDNKILTELWCFNNQLPLSDLYEASKMISDPSRIYLGIQRLAPQTIKIGEPIDYSAQKEFDSIPTDFIVEKNGLPASSNDYSIADGVITFNHTGYYTVTITNAAIISHPNYLAKVMAEFYVNPVDLMRTTEEMVKIKVYPNPTVGELRIMNYELRMGDIAIFDVYGKKLSSYYLITPSSNQIDISYLPAGIYFLKTGNETVRIVKQ